jgi:hypothetical protein
MPEEIRLIPTMPKMMVVMIPMNGIGLAFLIENPFEVACV